MDNSKKENTPFVIEFKNNYGTASVSPQAPPTPQTPSTLYCLHGHQHVELRGHCHKQRLEGVDVKARKKLIIASVLCVIFMIAEIVGGVLSNSLAIATDAAHLLTDFASFMISLFAIWIAGRPSTQRMSFGWYRAEVIGAMASVAMIWVITAILVWLAIQRIINEDYEVNASIMLITSGLAILVNLIMGFQLHGGHGHSHGGNSNPVTSYGGGGGGGDANNSGHAAQQSLSSASAPPAINNQSECQPPTKQQINGNLLTENDEAVRFKAILDKRYVDIETSASSNETIGNASDILDSRLENDSNIIENSGRIFGSQQNLPATQQQPQQLTISESIITPTNSNIIQNLHMAPMSTGDTNHGHNHHGENMNVRAAFIHVLGDVVQSIGVFLAALLIFFKPEWAIADPICTFIFSIIVLCTTFSIMKDALMVLMEGTPSYLDYTEVMEIFKQIDGVERVHNLRIWALTLSKNAVSVHLAIRPGANPKKILQEANTAVHRKYNFFETTIQIEDLTPDMEDCQQCTLPDP